MCRLLAVRTILLSMFHIETISLHHTATNTFLNMIVRICISLQVSTICSGPLKWFGHKRLHGLLRGNARFARGRMLCSAHVDSMQLCPLHYSEPPRRQLMPTIVLQNQIHLYFSWPRQFQNTSFFPSCALVPRMKTIVLSLAKMLNMMFLMPGTNDVPWPTIPKWLTTLEPKGYRKTWCITSAISPPASTSGGTAIPEPDPRVPTHVVRFAKIHCLPDNVVYRKCVWMSAD